MAGVTTTFREQAIVLGSQKSMVGILTPGQARPGAAERPFVIMINAGIIHRVGPNRLHVELARILAADGFSSLRFDLSGIGDSDKRTDGLPLLDATLTDIREVLDGLEASRGARQFVLLGLCSGADHGVFHAGADPRVVGLVLIDPSIPKTRGYYLRHYGSRLLKARSWLNLAGALPGHLFRLAQARSLEPLAQDPQEAAEAPSVNSAQARSYLKNAYQKAVDHGIEFLAVFSGDQEGRHNYREQILDALPGVSFGTRLRLERFGDADHTFTFEADRRRLFDLIREWMQSRAFNRDPASPRVT